MKKRFILILIIIFSIVLPFGCSSTNNEIYNKSYDVKIDLSKLQDVFIPATEIVTEATIGVNIYQRRTVFLEYAVTSTGSGVVYKAFAVLNDGSTVDDIASTKEMTNVNHYCYYAITNEHVVRSSSQYTKCKVYITDLDLHIDAQILGKNIIEDLAVVYFETSIYITPIELGNSDEIIKGELVLACGNPEGYDYKSSVTMGIISYPKRYVSVTRDSNSDGISEWSGVCEYIQHDAAINSGNSGGALVDINGKLIGINTMKIVNDNDEIDGMGFAIPVNIIKNNLDILENGNRISFYTINLTAYTINQIKNRDIFIGVPNLIIPSEYSYEYGLYIYSINLENYGLYPNDIVISLNNEVVINVDSINAILRKCQKGDKIVWMVFRGNEIQKIEQIL